MAIAWRAISDMLDAQRGLMSIQRYGDAEDVASLVTWLAGPSASTVTGAEFTIDSGTNA
ncbi:SDR family oxidoreductase [Wenzhouxiangella sediminis]|nr:SDR family oxidoreductase [Wenzhouxiangella sediminis]